MNREIKFRAWDSKNDVMRGWNYVCTNWTLGILNGDSNTEIMQFTGLHDKNGKEIYEGDVFKSVLGTVLVVAFDDGGFKLVKDRFFKTVAGDVYSLGDMNRLEADNGEIIGNIYEHPELIRGEDNN